ncbi:Anoctamin-10 [Blomia tropicalis]|nr:Anoctamin-10 [Blomia tropicalis]
METVKSSSKRKSVNNDEDIWSKLPAYCSTNSVVYLFVLNRNATNQALEHIVFKLKEEGLKISLVCGPHDKNKDIVLSVWCEHDKLVQYSSQVYMSQQLRRQCSSDDVDSNNWTAPEQERILLHILESIVQKDRSTMVGMDNVSIYPRQSIIQIYHREQVILDYFPLHQQDIVRKLTSSACSAFAHDIDSIRNYFGETIGFYFAFLNHYSNFFFWISILSLISYLFGNLYLMNELFTIVVCIGLFIFLKLWKRQSSRLACRWETIEAFELESARPSFRSKDMILDPITKENVPFYPIRKTWFKEYLLSLPFVILCMYISFKVMCLYFEIEEWTLIYCSRVNGGQPTIWVTILIYLPSIFYSLIVVGMNQIYRIYAIKLNDYENHRTQTSHENHLIVKLVLFESVNNFLSLFYIGFYLQDINMLKWNLITMLTINQFVDNVLETFLPLFTVYAKSNSIEKNIKKKDIDESSAKILWENKLSEYEDTYYDYLELFIQYGYSFLFISILPLAPVIAFLNSFVEIRLDGYKLCVAMRKPRQRSAKSMNNAWMISFEVLSILVVISNLLTLSIVSNAFDEFSSYFMLTKFAFIVYVEHILLMLILLIWYIVPDIPKEVNLILSRQKYENIKTSNLQSPKKNMQTSSG